MPPPLPAELGLELKTRNTSKHTDYCRARLTGKGFQTAMHEGKVGVQQRGHNRPTLTRTPSLCSPRTRTGALQDAFCGGKARFPLACNPADKLPRAEPEAAGARASRNLRDLPALHSQLGQGTYPLARAERLVAALVESALLSIITLGASAPSIGRGTE